MNLVKSETTSNQLDNSTAGATECEFNICPYQFPDIHMHIYIDNDKYNDGGIIYAGSNVEDNMASATTGIEAIPDGYQLDAVNWYLDVSEGSYAQAGATGPTAGADTITIDIDFMNTDGSVIASDGPGTFTGTWGDGDWHSINGTYNDSFIPDISSVMMTIGGVDYQNNTDGIRFANMSITYDYSEVILIPEVIEEIINDLIALSESGVSLDEITIADVISDAMEDEEVVEEVSEEVSEETSEEEAEESSEEETTEEESSEETTTEEVTTEVKEAPAKVVVAKTTVQPKKEVKKVVVASTSKTTTKIEKKTSNNVVNIDQVISTLNIIQNINKEALQLALIDTVNFNSYTGQFLQEAVDLEDNENWYQDQAFYIDSGILVDSNILTDYSNININDNGEWYGSNN
jgi:hypothetical protein